MATTHNPEEARRRIEELERDLRRNHYYYAADALKQYLDGEARTLDEAFGLTAAKSRGRPVTRRNRHLEIARDVLKFRLRPDTGEQAAISVFEQSLADKYHLSDARKVRAIYARYQNEVISEELHHRLEAFDEGTKQLRGTEKLKRAIKKDQRATKAFQKGSKNPPARK